MLWWILAIIFILYVYFTIRKKQSYWKDRNVPHEKPTFFFGNIGPFVLRKQAPADWLLELYMKVETRYTGFYRFFSPNLLIKDVELLKQIYVKDFDSFMNHKGFVSEDTDPLFGKNLFSLKGNPWREMRANLSPAFTGSKMRAMFNLIAECAEQFTKYHEDTLQPGKAHSMEMKEVFTRFANDVIATSAFGIKCDSLEEPENEFYVNAKKASNFGGVLQSLKILLYILSPTLTKLLNVRLISKDVANFFINLIIGAMKYREEKGIYRPDMIQLLMDAKNGKLRYEEDKNDKSGFATVEESQIGKEMKERKQEWTDIELTAQATIFFIAGFDTVSTVLSFWAYEMALNPVLQRKLQNEIDAVREQTDGKITYEKITKMEYMDKVVSEVLRKWPPAPMIDRECSKPFTIHATESNETDVHLNKGDLIWIPIYGIHRDPKHYPNPERFDPERFSDENKKNIAPFTYLPFGSGPRNCIGSRFALMEIKLLAFHLLSSFDILRDEKTQVPFKFSVKNMTFIAEDGFWVSFKKRAN